MKDFSFFFVPSRLRGDTLSAMIFLLLLFSSCNTVRKNATVQEHTPSPRPLSNADVKIASPAAYFRFEKENILTNDANKRSLASVITPKNYIRPLPALVAGVSPAGVCMNFQNGNLRQNVVFDGAGFPADGNAQFFSVEMALKFDPDSMCKFRMGFSNSLFEISPEKILVRLNDSTDAKYEQLVFSFVDGKLAGWNEKIYDGSWHHFAFSFSNDSVFRVYIDGKTNSALAGKLKSGKLHVEKTTWFEASPAIHTHKMYLDEMAFYFEESSPEETGFHAQQFFKGEAYTFGKEISSFHPETLKLLTNKNINESLEFAPGYPAYSVSQIDQLKSFPLPRFKPGNNFHRNFPWYDLKYLAYDNSLIKEKGPKEIVYPGMMTGEHAERALAIDKEMYSHWNYFFNLPTPTYYARDFSNPATLPGKLTSYANQHPEIETSCYLFWGGINPSKAGFASVKPFIRSNENIDPCKDTSFSPIKNDGITQRKNLEALANVMPLRDPKKKIDFVNEDGEVFGESSTPNAEGYRGNPFISCIQKDSLTARRDRAVWQYKVFHAYESSFIRNAEFPALYNSEFSFYQVSAFLPAFYGEYAVLRKLNTKTRQQFYSTPDFYPGKASWNIFQSHGPYHGIKDIIEGRKKEIQLHDYYFSPFVCAGWFDDSVNFRPAEWLAANKAMGMLGAEFYYGAYFNTGNPNAKKVTDPRGYVWQVAIPAYAQAVTSRYSGIFFNSHDFQYNINFNRLLIYRKKENVPLYAIHASVLSQASEGYIPPDTVANHVNIDGDILKINFLRQGATYIYDKRDPGNIIFYQLDSWQETSHPYYWPKDFLFEAEVSDDTMQVQLHTELPANAAKNDYTNFTTYASFANANITHKQLSFHFEPRNDTGYYYIWVRARSAAKDGMPAYAKFSLDGNTTIAIGEIQPGEFKWYCYVRKGESNRIWVAPDVEHELRLIAADKNLELDKVLLSESPKRPD
jgi:hypothetical protein